MRGIQLKYNVIFTNFRIMSNLKLIEILINNNIDKT